MRRGRGGQSARALDEEAIQRIIDRFAAAKWITGLNINGPDYLHLEYTVKGREELKQLGDSLRPFVDHKRGLSSRKPSLVDWYRMLSRLWSATRRLGIRGYFSPDHRTLAVMASAYEEVKRS